MSWQDIIKARRRVSRSILSIAISPAEPALLQVLLSGINIPGVDATKTPEPAEHMEDGLFWSFVLGSEAEFYKNVDLIKKRLKDLKGAGVIKGAEIQMNEVRV
jgi:hypothetical protein